MHISSVNSLNTKPTLRVSRKPYERYKDMRLAIKLLEKGENPIFNAQDDTTPLATPPPDCTFTPNFTHMQFPTHRMRVGFQKSAVKYRSYLLRAKSVDRLRMT